jgi:hypothetical protein
MSKYELKIWPRMIKKARSDGTRYQAWPERKNIQRSVNAVPKKYKNLT